ncbi:ABC transporter substrate-binding protein [Motiliproteus sp. MSK22-1]|uniref:substrate-binding periplasmic protein n=1 Tax=Motiliproteus sp. MSK22-1 TaxID=1897630 RepID=UPI0009765DB5|nr:transporter substrate-binding domain-containing protein [Motiliproteus sp. MSK22-1]OMH38842.1 hypothetical protein BGP75_00230 [Motiliproteus sp. MSK22-1]
MYVLLTLILLAIPTISKAIAKEVSIAVYEYSPFIGPKLDRGGIIIELVETIFKHAGYETRRVTMPLARAIATSKNAGLDVIPGLWRSPELEQQFLYGKRSLLTTPLGLYKKRANDVLLDQDNSGRITVAIPRGYSYTSENDLSHLYHVSVNSDLQALKLVLKGRVKFALTSLEVAKHLFMENLHLSETHLELTSPLVGVRGFYIGISHQHPNGKRLLDDYERSFSELFSRGLLQQIVQRWRLTVKAPISKSR